MYALLDMYSVHLLQYSWCVFVINLRKRTPAAGLTVGHFRQILASYKHVHVINNLKEQLNIPRYVILFTIRC